MADEVLINDELNSGERELELRDVIEAHQPITGGGRELEANEPELAPTTQVPELIVEPVIEHPVDVLDGGIELDDDTFSDEMPLLGAGSPPLSAYEDMYPGEELEDEQGENPFSGSQAHNQDRLIDDIMEVTTVKAAQPDVDPEVVVEPEADKVEADGLASDQNAEGATPAPAEKTKTPKSSAAASKPIDPSERNAILEHLKDLQSLSEEKLIKLLDEELGRERSDKFMEAVDRYTNANPQNLHAIPVDFIIKRLDNLSAKVFSKDRISDLGLDQRELNLDDDSAMSMADDVKNTAPPVNKNEYEMNNRDRDHSRVNAENVPVESGGLGAAMNALMMRIGGKNKTPTVDSVVGANSSLKPTDTVTPSYSQQARQKYTNEMCQQLQHMYDKCAGVEKSNTPKNRRDLFRAMEQVDSNLKKGQTLLADPSSFESPAEFKKFADTSRLLRSKMNDLKRDKVVGEENESFKSLFETLKKMITETLDKVASVFKSAEKSQNKDISAGPSM
ncbi:hypothetical protein ACTG16_23840 [Aeromonas sp. 23P]|uniref:hypothetical protein n=1 Tax=Aeromonas sp. 23P TaxID=3452716 RepID=UPI003F796B19